MGTCLVTSARHIPLASFPASRETPHFHEELRIRGVIQGQLIVTTLVPRRSLCVPAKFVAWRQRPVPGALRNSL